MDRTTKQRILQRVVEGLSSIVLVLAFFFVLIMVFNALFPEGSGLQFIFSPQQDGDPSSRSEKAELLVARGDEADLLFNDETWAANLTRTRNQVKSKKADDIAWQTAEQGMQLHNLDAVQTFEESSAQIRFDGNSYVDLGEKSLIIIRRMEQDLLFKEKRSFMVVVDGELRGRIGGGDENGTYLEISTPNAVARLQARPESDEGIDFKIDVLGDDASTVTIYAGEGEVEAQGETVFLDSNQLTRIEGDAAPLQPVTLPAPVTLSTPADGELYPYRSLPPRVRLSWEPQPGALEYHLQIASDGNFHELLVDKIVGRPEFTHGNLRDGDYFWRISSLNNAGEGRFGTYRRFRLQQDQSPPLLEVEFPPVVARRQHAEILGRSEPESRLYISGNEIVLDREGRFQHNLPLKRGINVVVVEAVDRAGNISYRSQLINGQY